MNHIELFAGCGGLSLGLKKVGFDLTLANELSPMAAETFSYNLLGEDLEVCAEKSITPKHTFWLSTQYDSLAKRLRENPFHYPELNQGLSTLLEDPRKVEGGLIIGNIIQLNEFLIKTPSYLEAIKNGFAQGGIDLVSGGPPCQSFSLAGLRKKNCDRNTLPWEFARFVGLIKPKCVVLENVTGILRPFNEDGRKYYAWLEVAKTFANQGYIPLCIHINARNAGVAQNRPRFIMIALRVDIYEKIASTFNFAEKQLFAPAYSFYLSEKEGRVSENYLYYDFSKDGHVRLFQDSFLSSFYTGEIISVEDAIDDLKFSSSKKPSDFVKNLNNYFHDVLPKKNQIDNHEPRSNSDIVRRRFRIYQVLQQCSPQSGKEITQVIRGLADDLTELTWNEVKKFKYLHENGELINFDKKSIFLDFLKRHPTKKQTQKALISDRPAPAALSIPDDACHYDKDELRTLTVREMARIQSFPDAFTFKSKVTTGGKMRRFEVPQYTQVGNAVPPLLGVAIGKAVKNLLTRI